jgi:hypothetical protein
VSTWKQLRPVWSIGFVVVVLGNGCGSNGVGLLDGGSLDGDGACYVRDGGAAREVVPLFGQFTGGATGILNGVISSSVDISHGTWNLSLAALPNGGPAGGNVLALQGAGLTIRGVPRQGTFDFASPDVLDGQMLISLAGPSGGTQLVAILVGHTDGGVVAGGWMSLSVASTMAQGECTDIAGSLDIRLVNNDPSQTSPTAMFHATF